MPIDYFRFLLIFLCFLLSFRRGLPFAAFLTLCADYFLLFTEDHAAGLSLFLLVQLAYLQNLRRRPFPFQAMLLLPFGLFCPLPFLGGWYAFLFFCHFLLAFKKVQQGTHPKLYLFGLSLFAFCDITVAWGYFYTPNPSLVWLFYAPAQFLLALTAREKSLISTL